jgi:hypothetical protein
MDEALRKELDEGKALMLKLFDAIAKDDVHEQAVYLTKIVNLGFAAAFATASCMAAIPAHYAKSKMPGGKIPEGAVMGPGFVDKATGEMVWADHDDVPAYMVFAGQMIAAVANDDVELQLALFNALVALGVDAIVEGMSELVTQAGRILKIARGNGT